VWSSRSPASALLTLLQGCNSTGRLIASTRAKLCVEFCDHGDGGLVSAFKFGVVLTQGFTDELKNRIHSLATDFPALWSNPNTAQRDRKRMVRLLVDDVTLHKTDQIHLHIRFRGGQTTSLTVATPPTAWQARQTHPDTLAALDRLLDTHTDAEAADALNTTGHRSGQGNQFTATIVIHLRRKYHLPSHADRLRAQGLLTANELAQRLCVHRTTIKNWTRAGILNSHKANDKNERLYQPPTPGDPRLTTRQGSPLKKRVHTQPTAGGAV
jgi:hypothetical protein